MLALNCIVRSQARTGEAMQDTFTVETLAITGQFVPQNGEHVVLSFHEASVASFAARLIGQVSRIVAWPTGEVVAIVPPHVTQRQIRNLTRGI